MSNNTSSSGGVGLGGLLVVLFVGLKLTGYIDWSWWWVLSPLWVVFLLAFMVVAAIIIATSTVGISKSKKSRK